MVSDDPHSKKGCGDQRVAFSILVSAYFHESVEAAS